MKIAPFLLISSGVAALMMQALTAVPAAADHGNEFPIPDDTIHDIDRFDLHALSKIAVDRGILELDRTDVNATFNGSDEDVNVYDGYYGTSGEWNTELVTLLV